MFSRWYKRRCEIVALKRKFRLKMDEYSRINRANLMFSSINKSIANIKRNSGYDNVSDVNKLIDSNLLKKELSEINLQLYRLRSK